MAVNTSNTILKYALTCPLQVETATVVGTITTAGNATVTVTGRDIVGSPLAVSVPVAINDTASQVATKIITALRGNQAITQYYSVSGTTDKVVLTKLVPQSNDSTLNIAISNGTSVGLTASPTSAHTTNGGTFTKLCDIIGYPDLGSTPSKLDTTDLTDTVNKTSIFGLQESPDMAFECNYDKTVYNTINGLTQNNYFFELDFGSSDGKFDWQGQVKVFTTGGSVDEVRKMTVTTSASTPISFSLC